jgi:two-component system, cell cycle sensor histidine kinase and response regulator CckA
VLSTAKPEPSAPPLHVLLVSERDEDFFLIREILDRNRHTLRAELDQASSLQEAKARLERGGIGLVLFDHSTPDGEAMRLLSDLLRSGSGVPFLLLTEHADEKAIAEIIQAGAVDCLEKSQLTGADLVRTMRCCVNLNSSRQQQLAAEESLRKLSRAVEQSADEVIITDLNGVIEYVNPAFEAVTGYSSQEVIGKNPRILKSGEHDAETYRSLWQTILSGNVYRGILANKRKNGEIYYIEKSISPIRDTQGRITHFVANGRDLTERRRVEGQLAQAQKMDAIGRLAGGVAHDFNNLLTIITSYSELALDSVVPGTPLQSQVQEILSAARRATELTRQLLAFGRKQPQALRVVELNAVVGGIVRTLRRLIGEDIEFNFLPGKELGHVRLDPVQVEQILMNLAANSRDAMPQGGRFTVETSDVYLDDEYVQKKRAVIPKGRHILLTVSDSGVGIPADHLPHIFEPFYTTKPTGQGTGLGLATVYGIVKQNHGFVWVYSEPGMGTIFKIYFPCVDKPQAATEPVGKNTEAALPGTETVLLVEDEDAVRRSSAEYLTRCGYTVLQARDGVEAVSLVKNHTSPIDLLITDVVMPHMSGGQLANEMESLRPETKVLFVSGYAGQTVVNHNVVDVESNFLQKPFTLRQLARKVRTALGTRAGVAQA